MTGTSDPERVPVKMITASLLPLLGVSLPAGRNFSEAEDRAGGGGVAIIGAAFAGRRFAGLNPVGQPLQLETGQPVGRVPQRSLCGGGIGGRLLRLFGLQVAFDFKLAQIAQERPRFTG